MSAATSNTTLASPTGGPDNNNGGSNNNNRNNTNNNGNNNTFDNIMGTNVYLYGFLSTLILIFLVSVAVAYKGYRTRALLRQRIDEALAAGVFIPGVSSDDGTGGRRRRDAAEKPILSEVWLRRRRGANIGKWDQLQPLSVQPLPHIPTTSEPSTPMTLEEWAAQHPFQRGPRSLLFPGRRTRSTATPQPPPTPTPPSNDNAVRVVGGTPVPSIPLPGDGIRQPPTPQSSHNPPQPLPAPANPQSANPESQQAVEVPLLLSIIIAMPDPSRPRILSSSPHPHRSSMTSAKGKERESDSSHEHSHDGEESEIGNGELPELVLGYAGVPLVVRAPPPPGSTPVSASASASVPPTPPVQVNQPSRMPSLRAVGSPSVPVAGS